MSQVSRNQQQDMIERAPIISDFDHQRCSAVRSHLRDQDIFVAF